MRFIFVILYTLIATQACVSLNSQVTVEHAPLKACNAISEGVTQQLLDATPRLKDNDMWTTSCGL